MAAAAALASSIDRDDIAPLAPIEGRTGQLFHPFSSPPFGPAT
jgi:hypothetical protein